MAVDADCDLLVIGGGINGAAIARDAAGRTAMLLCRRDDLAAHTSGASTKLLHGAALPRTRRAAAGRAGLAERERLLRLARSFRSRSTSCLCRRAACVPAG